MPDDLCKVCNGPAHSHAVMRHEALTECRDRLAARLAQYKRLYEHALDCVDRVFQVCVEIPNPILPDFLGLGQDKFAGVVRLAEAYKTLAARATELERELAAYREEAERLRPARECPGCGRSTERVAWCDECVQANQDTLAARVAELERELEENRDALVARVLARMARTGGVTPHCDWQGLPIEHVVSTELAILAARVAELEQQLAEERDLTEAMKDGAAQRIADLEQQVELERENKRLRADVAAHQAGYRPDILRMRDQCNRLIDERDAALRRAEAAEAGARELRAALVLARAWIGNEPESSNDFINQRHAIESIQKALNNDPALLTGMPATCQNCDRLLKVLEAVGAWHDTPFASNVPVVLVDYVTAALASTGRERLERERKDGDSHA